MTVITLGYLKEVLLSHLAMGNFWINILANISFENRSEFLFGLSLQGLWELPCANWLLGLS